MTFSVEFKRSVSCVFVRNKAVMLTQSKTMLKSKEKNDKETMIKINSLINQVAKSVNRFIVASNFEVNKLKQYYPALDTNRIKWSKMKAGDEFYYIDISHCYWRIGYMHGYINEKLYQNILKKPEIKQYRNMSLALIIAPRGRDYWVRGKWKMRIQEDKTLYSIIYNNIRFTCYNVLGEMNKLFKQHSIGYRTDGIMVTKPAVSKVKKYLADNGFDYTVEKCTKINDGHYLIGTKVKRM